MTWLLWKDYRVNRVIVFVALGLFIVPHALALHTALVKPGPLGPPGMSPLQACLWLSAIFSLCVSQICLALLGGNMIAGERADRSAEFLAYMPVTRSKILTAKLFVALSIIAFIWIPNSLLILRSFAAIVPNWRDTPELLFVLGPPAITGLMFFCVAWLFSSMLHSPTFATGAGLLAPILVSGGIYWVGNLCGRNPDQTDFGWWYMWWYAGISLPLAAVSFVAGTCYYLRRVEP